MNYDMGFPPEGATHYRPMGGTAVGGFWKKDDRNACWYAWISDRWVYTSNPKQDSQSPVYNIETYKRPKTLDSATPAEWDAASRAARMPVTDEEERMWKEKERQAENVSDGSTASYYELPPGCTELQDLISYRNLNAQDGEIFRAIYRKGRASHSDELRDARKVLFYAKAEVERLEKLCIG